MVRVSVVLDIDLLWTGDLGKLVYANAAGIPIVFLNDFQANEDLINTRGDKYADKPNTVMLNELCSGKFMVSIRLIPPPARVMSL